MPTEFDPILLNRLFEEMKPQAPPPPDPFEVPPPPPQPRAKYFFDVLGLSPRNAAILNLQSADQLEGDEFYFMETVYNGAELSPEELQRLSDITERLYWGQKPKVEGPKQRIRGRKADFVLVDDAMTQDAPSTRGGSVQALAPSPAIRQGSVDPDWFEKK